MEIASARAHRSACRIELRFFGGLTSDGTATALGIAAATVGRELRMAEAWLYQERQAVTSGDEG